MAAEIRVDTIVKYQDCMDSKADVLKGDITNDLEMESVSEQHRLSAM